MILYLFPVLILCYLVWKKTANILRLHHWFPCEMYSKERAQKFYTDDTSLSRSG